MPQVVAVAELGEAALFGPAAEAVKRAKGHVLLIGHASRGTPQLLAGQGDQALKVSLPERLGGGAVAGTELVDPGGDAAEGRHGREAPLTREFRDRRLDRTPGVPRLQGFVTRQHV